MKKPIIFWACIIAFTLTASALAVLKHDQVIGKEVPVPEPVGLLGLLLLLVWGIIKYRRT